MRLPGAAPGIRSGPGLAAAPSHSFPTGRQPLMRRFLSAIALMRSAAIRPISSSGMSDEMTITRFPSIRHVQPRDPRADFTRGFSFDLWSAVAWILIIESFSAER
jgi:hypothetical protein